MKWKATVIGYDSVKIERNTYLWAYEKIFLDELSFICFNLILEVDCVYIFLYLNLEAS